MPNFSYKARGKNGELVDGGAQLLEFQADE